MTLPEPGGRAAWRARTCEAAARVADLAAERTVLEEAREGLLADQRERARRLAAQERTNAELEAALRSCEERGVALQGEIEQARQEIELAAIECSVDGRRGQALLEEERRLQRQLVDREEDLRATEAALLAMQERLVRMEAKLAAGAPGGRATGQGRA